MKSTPYILLALLVLLPVSLSAQNNSSEPLKMRVIRLDTGVLNTLAVRKVKADYPEEARVKNIEGPVTLRVLVDTAGNVVRTHVVRGNPILADAAQKAVQHWKFKPFTIAGEPSQVEGTVTLNFLK